MSDVNAYLKDMTGTTLGTSGNPLYTSITNAVITATINAEDIEIGGVEIKDAVSDIRLEVATDGSHNAAYVMSSSLGSEVTLAYASVSLAAINTTSASIWNKVNGLWYVTATQDKTWFVEATVSGAVTIPSGYVTATQDKIWFVTATANITNGYVTATQDKAWYVNATVSGAVNASQTGAWTVSATVTAPASGVWTREAIHSGTSIFNTALPATNTDWFTPIAPTYSPGYFNVHVAVATAGKLSYSRTRAGATVVCDFNSGVNLTANAEYAFTIPALTGDTISLRYDKFGYNILSCYVFEKGA